MDGIIGQSRAVDSFKIDVQAYCAGRAAPSVRVEGFAPRVKVERLLMQLLSSEPSLPIEAVHVRGRAGCSDFVGEVIVETRSDTRVYDFVWDCRWRAEQQGWIDCFGFPDQLRAAREFGWRCFQVWSARSPLEELAQPGVV